MSKSTKRRSNRGDAAQSRLVTALWQRFHRRGLIQRQITDLGALLDLAFARGEFVRALGRYTVAWDALVTECRALHPSGKEGQTLPTPEETAIVDGWLRANSLDVPWMREWAGRAVVLISDAFSNGPSDKVPIDHVVLNFFGAPEPAEFQLLEGIGRLQELAGDWSGDERPPNPIIETREVFLARTERAWDERVRWLGASPPTKRCKSRSCPCPDMSTVKKALKAFPELIELPPVPSDT